MVLDQKILEHFNKNDKKIYEYIAKVDYSEWFGDRDNPKDHTKYFSSLCRNIIGQQLSGSSAKAINERFINLLDKKITPDRLLKVAHEDLRKVGLSNAKARYIKDLAEKVKSGELKLEELNKLSVEEIINRLTMVNGIGIWTAEMFAMFALHRQDVFSFGDLGLRKGLIKVYDLDNITRETADKIVKKWTPYKTYGSIALWYSLEDL